MEESITFYLPNILKMFEDPYAAWRLLFPGTQVFSLYCYNYFSRTGFFSAYTNGKFVILNIYVIKSLNEPPDEEDFHCVSSNKTNLCIFSFSFGLCIFHLILSGKILLKEKKNVFFFHY